MTVFPCPFCRARAVRRVGGTATFAYYQCDGCRECWTALNPAPRPPHVTFRDTKTAPAAHLSLVKTGK